MPSADLPNDLQNLGVIARHGGVAVAVHPGAMFDALRGIPLNRQANAREGRQQHMLVEGGLIAKALGKIIDMFGFHPSAGKAGGPAAGQPLAKAIPVIFRTTPVCWVLTRAITSLAVSLRRANTSIQSAYSAPVL